MGLIALVPVSQAGLLQCPTVTASIPGTTLGSANPAMYYDSTLGTPTAQGLIPPFPTLPAFIYEINGIATAYGWNPTLAQWL